MKRPIVAFHRDVAAHWVADLSCGHAQHTRHLPPLSVREWVESEEGRASRLGTLLDCLRCDRAELPEGYAPYKRTPEFNRESVPRGLLGSHSTRAGVWGLIHVSSGRLEYRVEGGAPITQVLEPGAPGVVLPEVEHSVAPLGPVSFHVEFWRSAE